MGIPVECTASNTPQQDGRFEYKLATIFGKVNIMLNGKNSDLAWRKVLWLEAANVATKMEKNIRAFQHFFERRRMQKVGEKNHHHEP